MKKVILMGGIFAIILLLLIPISSAVQINSIKRDNYFLEENFETNNVTIDTLGDMKFPRLYKFVMSRIISRYNYSLALREFSADFINEWHGFGYWEVHHPLIFYYSWLIFFNCVARLLFWEYISLSLNWNWDIQPYS